MDIGDKESTTFWNRFYGYCGTVIDRSSYEVETPLTAAEVCVQWEDDLAPHKDSWERRNDLSMVEAPLYDFSISK